MLLAVDIGNTNITLGVFDGEELQVIWRMYTRIDQMPDEYAIKLLDLLHYDGLDVRDIDAVAISCVVPPLRSAFVEVFQRYFDVVPLVVGPGIKNGIQIRVDNPREVGSDRICNVAAAHSLYKETAIVVAMGTALVFDTISKEGSYIGGAVAPGIGIASEALFTRTAALPRVELMRPKSAIGTNIVGAMQSGIIFGYAGLIEGVVARIRQELKEKAIIVGTGGYIGTVAGETEIFDFVNPELTLIGLKHIYGLNNN